MPLRYLFFSLAGHRFAQVAQGFLAFEAKKIRVGTEEIIEKNTHCKSSKHEKSKKSISRTSLGGAREEAKLLFE
jgi:hypothetical protein